MVEFSRENYLNLSARENPFNLGRSKYFFLRRKQNSPISSHARPTIKECNHATCTGDKIRAIDHATSDLLTRQYTKTPELTACDVEMNLT